MLLEASDGASDYGNKFGEPVISGFTRSFGLLTPDGRREWVKPIMFSGGIGTVEDELVNKIPPEEGEDQVTFSAGCRARDNQFTGILGPELCKFQRFAVGFNCGECQT